MIRIEKAVTFLLPFNRYRLKLSHRLLDSLGGVSRFLLGAIEQDLSLAELIEVTGLRYPVLLNQLVFLQNHRYIDALESDEFPILRLTPRGIAMMQVQRLLHDFELTVWLDAFTLRRHAVHLALFPQSMSSLENATSSLSQDSIVVTLPHRRGNHSGRLHLFEEASRLRVLLDKGALRLLLEHSWGEDCALIGDEFDHWECELQTPEAETETAYLPVCFAPGQLTLTSPHQTKQNVTSALPPVSLPILEIQNTFRPVKDFPWPTATPAAETCNLELVSATILPDSMYLTDANEAANHCATIPPSNWPNRPDSVPQPVVPPGVSCEVSIRKRQSLFIMDEQELSQRLHHHPEALVISHNTLAEPEQVPA